MTNIINPQDSKKNIGTYISENEMPNAKDLEKSVLGSCMTTAGAFEIVESLLQRDCFYVSAYKYVFHAMSNLAKQGQVIDISTVIEQLKVQEELEKVGGAYGITQLTSNTILIAKIPTYCLIIREKYVKREYIYIGQSMMDSGLDPSTDALLVHERHKKDIFYLDSKILTKHFPFIPDWSNKPKEIPDVIKLSDTGILSFKNLSAIIANPGFGKTSVLEAIACSFLNPDADSLGFQVNPLCKGILIIDTERPDADVWKSFYRICKRAGIPTGQELKNVKIAGLRNFARLSDRKRIIERLIKSGPVSLLLVDGAGDLVADPNDLDQAIECRVWLRELTQSHDISTLTTLHSNSNSDKPRGHVGSELLRESESVLLIKNDGDTHILTTEFEFGKNRNNPKLNSAFTWSDSKMMFISTDFESIEPKKQQAAENRKKENLSNLAKEILPFGKSFSNIELVNALITKQDISERTAQTRIKTFLANQLVEKGNDNFYRLKTNKAE
jgi:hypothetical protein